MSFPRKHWDLTHLSSKYPWLRVDQETIQEFRSPFQWVQADVEEQQETQEKQLEKKVQPKNGKYIQKKRKLPYSTTSSASSTPMEDCRNNNKTVFSCQMKSSNEKSIGKRKEEIKEIKEEEQTKVDEESSAIDETSMEEIFSIENKNTSSHSHHPAPIASMNDNKSITSLENSLILKNKSSSKKKKKKKKLRSLSFPTLHSTFNNKTHTQTLLFDKKESIIPFTAIAQTKIRASSAEKVTQRFEKELAILTKAEIKLQQDLNKRIEQEKAKIPLQFLFERNLQAYCQAKSVENIIRIFSKLHYRMIFSTFQKWHEQT
jgi:hypothetical protein